MGRALETGSVETAGGEDPGHMSGNSEEGQMSPKEGTEVTKNPDKGGSHSLASDRRAEGKM